MTNTIQKKAIDFCLHGFYNSTPPFVGTREKENEVKGIWKRLNYKYLAENNSLERQFTIGVFNNELSFMYSIFICRK